MNDTPPQKQPPQTSQKSPSPSGLGTLVKWILVLALAVGGYFGWQYWRGHSQIVVQTDATSTTSTAGGRRGSFGAGGNAPQTVRSAEIVAADVPITLNALGGVTPLVSLNVQAQVSGQLQKLGFAEGQMVKRGDFIAQIDDRPYRASLAQAQSQLDKDTALENQASSDLTRYQTLIKQDSIASQQVDDQKFLVKQYAAAMSSDQALIDAAQLNIDNCRITSSIDGRAGLRQVDEGNNVQAGSTSIVLINQMQPISVVFSIPEDSLSKVLARMKAGASLPVTAYDRGNIDKIATGVLSAVDAQIDSTTGTVKLRAVFDNKDDALFPQQFVNIRMLVDTVSGATVAPNSAIQQGVDGSFVYVINEDQTVSVRAVKTGTVNGESTLIASGLKVGEHVVVDGVDRLKEGVKVIVRDAPVAANAPATPTSNAPPATDEQAKPAAVPVDGAANAPVDPNAPPKRRNHKGDGSHKPADGTATP
ncbi:MAG: efflux RND transporter periplasmic adaptor subunit [Aestuariivirga sp.]